MILSKKQKAELEPLVESQFIAMIAFYEASKMIKEAKEKLWEKVEKICPNASELKHPMKGNWEIVEREDNE